MTSHAEAIKLKYHYISKSAAKHAFFFFFEVYFRRTIESAGGIIILCASRVSYAWFVSNILILLLSSIILKINNL